MSIAALINGLLAGAGLMSPAALQTRVEAFSGQPALVDPRLLLPACTRPDFAWVAGGRSIMVRCAAPVWRVFVPVGESGVVAAVAAPAPLPAFVPRAVSEAPAVRRGERVTLEVGGDGFVIGMDAVAESDSRGGRVPLRAGGRRLTGVIGDDGHVRLRGGNGAVPLQDSSNMLNGR